MKVSFLFTTLSVSRERYRQVAGTLKAV